MQEKAAQTGAARFSVRTVNTIELEPSGAVFDVPQEWVALYETSGKNLHLRRSELARVEEGDGVEWKTQYADVLNAAWPFDNCAFEGGSEGWGPEFTSFADLQVRAYVTTDSANTLHQRLESALRMADRIHAASLTPFSPAGRVELSLKPAATFIESTVGRWKKDAISFHVFFGDYDGTARIHFYSTECNHYSVTLAFMRAVGDDPRLKGNAKDEQHIVSSFACSVNASR